MLYTHFWEEGEVTNLRGVMVEDDRAEITTVVMCNEIFCGVGALQAPRSHALVLQQRLVQSKQHLKGKDMEREVFILSATVDSVFSAPCSGRIQ